MAHSPTPSPTPRFNETAIAIAGSLVLSIVLATLLVGNPFRSLRLAFTDYSHTPATGTVPSASTTRAPEPDKK